MDRRYSGSTPLLDLHINELINDSDQMLVIYDQMAQEIIELGRPEGYFESWDTEALRWPQSRTEAGPIDLEGLQARVGLVDAFYQGVPRLRDERLAEAYEQFSRLAAAYQKGNRIYRQVKAQFTARGAGTEQDFLQLYQTLYIEALAKGDLFAPDVGEAALAQARVSRVPLSHAQVVAEALSTVVLDDDLRWEVLYSCTVDGVTVEASLRDLLRDVAQRTLDHIAAGELLATRYNTYNNLGWFGSSVWKVVVGAELLLHRLAARPNGDAGEQEAVRSDIRLAQGMLIAFFQAHREDPARLKPEKYWYGQDYSYLTRDMIDLGVRLVGRVNRLVRDANRFGGEGGLEALALPPLLAGEARGRFVEYPQVGRRATLSPGQRAFRLGRWALASWKTGRRRVRLARSVLEEDRRLERAWQEWLRWAEATLRIFDIQVKICIDPQFFRIARELDLDSGKRKVLFLPAHQSLLDHPIMYHVLGSSELMAAMGWEKPRPCVLLGRTGLSRAGVRIGPWDFTMFGVSSETFDWMLEEVDGYVTRERVGGTGSTAMRVVAALGKRPGIIYPMGTTPAFGIQLFPLQHGMFAQLPHDVVIVPIVFRGAHSLWPKCPKGNLNINPGVVEAVVAPPMLGETTLLPKRRRLRIQLEAANLFQAVHISTLLNPEPSG